MAARIVAVTGGVASGKSAATAAFEHLTAMMCTCFFERRELLETSDPRVRAMYAWHAVEEVEHKAVAFDVLTKVAKVSYFRRIFSMLLVSIGFPITVMLIMNHMLQVDGFSPDMKPEPKRTLSELKLRPANTSVDRTA